MSIGSVHIFNYKTKEFETVPFSSNDTCESICIFIGKKLNIAPVTRLLFGLRVSSTQNWLPPSHGLQAGIKYDFRIRFKVPQLTTLKKLDLNSYDYFYRQVRYDLVNDKIPEIKYPAFKDNVLGLGVVDMYIDMIEKNFSIDDLEKNYKRYIPKELAKNHLYFAKRIIHKGLRDIKKKDHDIFYVKGTYLETIRSLAPNYLIEEFQGKADYLPEDEFESGTCPVNIEFNPFHEEHPGLRVYYNYKKEWKHITRLEEIYSMCRMSEDVVSLELSEHPNGFKLYFNNIPDLESFITYIGGYYRLSVKWTEDLCSGYLTPSLQELKELKCHGPIGGEFAYATIREKNNREGSCIVRQCEKNYDTYFIDINTKGSQTETFKITRHGQQWILHMQEFERSYDKLPSLINSIDTRSSLKFRIPMSKYDKPKLLLICLPKNQITSNKFVSKVNEADLHRNRVQIIDPKIDLRWYKNSQRLCEDGRIIQMRADWLLPDHTNSSVTLKLLKFDKDFNDFMQLANRWSKMYSIEFLKLYGLTLSTPYTLVMEHAPFGPLNKFLQVKDTVPLLCLLEAVHSLVRAIVYMQEKKILHGFIRCSKLQVIKYNPGTNLLLVKLSDPGFPKPYSMQDMPWIPCEYYDNPQQAKEDLAAELWAFATTVWEVFSQGKSPQYSRDDLRQLREKYDRNFGLLPPPCPNCPQHIMAIIKDGWSKDPDKRFSQQSIFSRLSLAKQAITPNYARPRIPDDEDTASLNSESDFSDTTEEIYLNGHSDSEASLERTPQLHSTASDHAFDMSNSVLILKNGKLTCQHKIGEGHYGLVFKGIYQMKNGKGPVPVAIKTLNERNQARDFKREIRIMQTLKHPNIVQILDHVDDGRTQSIIMEYIECGAFSIYLSCNKPSLTDGRLLRFAYDIAKGMHYLRSRNVIHRDLAARNILVGIDCLKISDFGLAQFADKDGYYYTQNKYRDLPVMWYSLEALKTNKFSFQSDVWSYGVTLFEIFSRGQQPPPPGVSSTDSGEIDVETVIDRLERGERLPKPENCNDFIYKDLMMPCWLVDPKSRPDFKEIMGKIELILGENGECI